ncbi:MAG: hypothetical protein A3B75_00740 [Candidatus Terrybacteria bacterium RIFCSPHIGHO2_02_FULL_43_14]|uniref:RNA polymerase sigma factor n=1 Tax=Candidatus Terrybacteria bacterium RIFCSPHIGHO2_01_FULL_43_35 TaxID=1802361 RepID=A0A1G2PG12_9BACT|nr:MAG: hypothetical protein A2828_02255 [Candidatus Terrybacteria bacterium RIFCSPHIGHO2_01_FULL_43_35]OHA50310.1 MAG: hypothetical protein A3B75_00740 [Candidatus Terrybacteria bacterium RIFCSPHIGHO2_02_FULL_43_14]
MSYALMGKKGQVKTSYMTKKISKKEQDFMRSYDAHADALFRHCYFRVYDRERAKELVQETFMRAWEYVVKGHKVQNLRAFLYRVAINLIIDESRKNKPVSLDELAQSGFDVASEEYEMLHTKIDASSAAALFKNLDDKHREVIILRYLDGFKPKEIARMLNESENVVSVRLHRAIKQISGTFTAHESR